MKLHVIFLPDLHFGPNKDNAAIQYALENIVYPEIIKTKPDIIIIGGDDSDDRLSLDQIAARYYLNFIMNITSFKKIDGSSIPVRFYDGTESHQKHQLQAFQWLLQDSSRNVKIYETVGEEIINGVNILYIPEESINIPKEEYYKKYLYSNNIHDMAFGHGLFDFISGGWGEREEKGIRGSPLWSYNDFKNSIKYGVFFGHIHIAQNYKNFIYYGGSLSRFCQGEEASKGFLSIYYSSKKDECHIDFIENIYAPKFVTRNLNDNLYNSPIESIIKILIDYCSKNNFAEFRVMIDKTKINKAQYQILREYFSENRQYKIRIEEIKDKREKSNEEINGINENAISNRNPEITNADDWILNTINYAKNTFNVTINKEKMIDIIAKCKQFNQ